MRSLSVILLLAFISLLLFGCGPSKHRPIDVYLTVESEYGDPDPPVGSNYRNYGMTITASVDSSVPAGEGTRYVCAGWTGTGSAPASGSTSSLQFTIIQNSTIIWHWQTQYYLTLLSSYGEPLGEGWYDEGATATWSVTTPWPGDPGVRYVTDTTSGDILMDSPKTITITWTTQYELTIEIVPEGSGTVELSPPSEDGYYDDGEVVTLTANPEPAYAFAYWSGDLSGTDNPGTLIMDGPKSVTANFVFPVIYVAGGSGQDTNDGLSWQTAVKTIQKGLDLTPATGWTVLVANGTYTGTGNKNLDFSGKAIHLKSVGGAANCIIDCENSGRGFYFHSGETNAAIVDGFTIQGGNSGGVGDGGAIYCNNSSPTFTNCTISGNTANPGPGGGVGCYSSPSPTFTNCTISDNSAGYGGGIFCYCSSSPTFTNCAISGNTATSYGGGVSCSLSNPTFTNCTISGNTATTYGGGACCYSDNGPTFRNSIIWGNTAVIAGHQIYTWDSSSSVTLSYSCYANDANDVAGSGTVTPDNCINTNPLFVGGGDYHLQGTSPCIDRGNNSYVPAEVTTDLDGNPRIQNGTVDMGAYEYQP